MAINTTDQNDKLQQTNEQLRTRSNLSTIINQDLFGVLTTERRIIVDNNSLIQLGNLNTNINYPAQISRLTREINVINRQIGPVTTAGTLKYQLERQRTLDVTAATVAALTALYTPPAVPSNTDRVATRNGIVTDRNNSITDINNQIKDLENQKAPLETERAEYRNIVTTYGPVLTLRGGELTSITTAANNLNVINQLPNSTPVNYGGACDFGGGANNTNLDTAFRGTGALPIGYNLCDISTGEPLQANGGGFQITTATGQTVTLRGLTITGNILTGNPITIDPVEGITFPLNLEIDIRGRITENTVNLDAYKTLRLTISAPQLPLADRDAAYTALNGGGFINQRIAAEYSNNTREQIENEVIWNMLRAGGNQAEIDAIYNNESHRNLLIERIRRQIAANIPVMNMGALQTGFRTDMTRINRNVPAQYLLNQNVFTNYLRQNMGDNIRTYVRGQITTAVDTPPLRTQVIQELLHFQSDVANNKVDNNDHLRALAAVPGGVPEGHPNSRFQRLTHRRSNKNNYTKFFEGREQNIADQSMETENGPVKYSVHVEVLGVNKMTATINIEGKDEPEIIDGANHNALVTAILQRRNTKDGEPLNRKLRCHMAIDIIKAVVMMSPQRLHREILPIPLPNAQGHNVMCDRVEAFVRGGNLMIRGGSMNPGTRVRENVSLFDEQRYKNLHDIDHLEDGIITLSTQINSIMNAMTGEYQEAVSTIGQKSLRTYNTNQFMRFGPAKKLRGRVAYGKTNWNFDFNTTANAGKKSVNVAFTKGIFTLSGEFNGQKYEFSGRNLGSLLRKKIDRKRIFDGIELDIVAQVNEAMVGQLRTNNMVGPEAFGVADLNDDKTGRVYIMDDAGNLSYLEIEDRALNPIPNGQDGRIPLNSIPPQRIRCNDAERREFMQNPFLSGRLIRSMRRRLAAF